MLRFFKTNAPYQIFSLLVLFLFLRLPQIIYGIPLLAPEFKWMLTGEQLAAGNLLYSDVLDDIGPFSGLVYGIIHFFAGRSATAYHVLAAIICLVHIYYLTLLAHSRQFFQERSYIPGLILCVLYNISFDNYTLNPALMGSTFLLFAFGKLVRQLDESNDEVFQIGSLIGVATLFFPPFLIFFIWALICINLYTGARLRQQMLIIMGFALPIFFVGLWYYINGQFVDFKQNFIISVITKRQFSFNDFSAFFTVYAIPVLLAVLGFFVALSASRFSNFQTRIQQMVLLWLVFGVLSAILMDYFAPHQFVFLLYPLAHFAIIFFTNFKKKMLAEVNFLLFSFMILFVNYQAFLPSLAGTKMVKLEKLRLKENEQYKHIRQKNILVLGNDLSPYLNNKSATPYINWSLAKDQFNHLDQYDIVIKVMQNLERDKPDFIIDQEQILPKSIDPCQV